MSKTTENFSKPKPPAQLPSINKSLNKTTQTCLTKIGCFEIHYLFWNGGPKRTVIFSKLQERRWPKWDEVKANLQDTVKHKNIQVKLKGSKDNGLSGEDLEGKIVKLVQNRKSGFNERIPKRITGKFVWRDFDRDHFGKIIIVIKKGDNPKHVLRLEKNDEYTLEFDSIDTREEFTVKIITPESKIQWNFCSNDIPDHKNSSNPCLFREFPLRELDPIYEMATIEILFWNSMPPAPALSVGMNKSKMSHGGSRKIESARPLSGVSKQSKSRPMSSMTAGCRGPAMKPIPNIVKTAVTDDKGFAMFADIPIGKYIIQFDGHSYLKPFAKEVEVDVNDEAIILREIKVPEIDEAYVIVTTPSENWKQHTACLYPAEEGTDFDFMPIEMSLMGSEYMAVVEPGVYWLYMDYGSGGPRQKLN
jgi:hypothetical protein